MFKLIKTLQDDMMLVWCYKGKGSKGGKFLSQHFQLLQIFQLKPINHLDSISKWTRTKTNKAKSNVGVNSFSPNKVYWIFGSKHISKERPSSNAKPISCMGVKFFGKKLLSSLMNANCSKKPSDPYLGSFMEGTSSCAYAKSSLPHFPMLYKASSAAEEIISPSKITNLESNDELQGNWRGYVLFF